LLSFGGIFGWGGRAGLSEGKSPCSVQPPTIAGQSGVTATPFFLLFPGAKAGQGPLPAPPVLAQRERRKCRLMCQSVGAGKPRKGALQNPSQLPRGRG